MSKCPETLTIKETDDLLCCVLLGQQLEMAPFKALRNYCMLLLMLDAGLRVGEVVKLTIADLLFRGEIIKTLTVRSEITKTKSDRTIPLSERLQRALKLYVDKFDIQIVIQADRTFFHHVIKTKLDNGIPLYTVKPYSVRRVQMMLDLYSWIVFQRRIHPHILRHTFATRLMKVLDIRGVQQALGHKQITSTQIYTHPDAESLKVAIEKMSNGDTK